MWNQRNTLQAKEKIKTHSSVQFSHSVVWLNWTLCDPMDCNTSGLPVHKQLLEFTQTHVHWVADAINHLNLCHPLLLSVMVENSDKMWSTGEGNGKPLQYSCLENSMNSVKRQKYRTLKDELHRLVGVQNATGDQCWKNSRKNEEREPKQKQHPTVDVTGNGSKVWCYKEQYCIGTWNIRFMNQCKLEVVKRDGKSDHWHFRNQRTKMAWNGWI